VSVSSTTLTTRATAVTDHRHDDDDALQNSDHSRTLPAEAAAATARPGGATRECRSNSDCNAELGESCVWLYDGCRTGQCMCDPVTGGPAPPTSDGYRRRRPWDIGGGNANLPGGYCHRVTARMFFGDELDAKCDLC